MRRYLSAIAQTFQPAAAKAQVIAHLLEPLGGDGGNLRVTTVYQPGKQRHMPGIDKELAGDGVGKVAVRLFHQQEIAVLTFIPAVGQGIFIAAAGQLSRIAEEVARLAQQIEADIGQREVNFQLRGMAAPRA